MGYSREYYWFSQYVLVTFLLLFSIVWSLISVPEDDVAYIYGFIPASLVRSIAEIIPQRGWFIFFECFLLMGMLSAYLGLWFYNEDVLTPPKNDLRTLTDSNANIIITENKDDFIENYAFKESSGIVDLPIMDVCDILYRTKNSTNN
ncbi:Phosphatidylinositol N-acetylglucosaminyltransferase subunit GPI19 [Nakaseomyces bracarensis]|uniref:Phosphatidylinositol N-acetylglucosaminyltransferase subunit GPI19 n=1 Tax=Nakaseomyces bracarensis TaxID=273131 RepID=A0ABR4NZV1_9SACH